MRKPIWLFAVFCSCASSPPPPPADEPADEPTPMVRDEGPAPAPTPNTDNESVGTDDYYLTNRDCRALASAYAKAWESEQMKVLSDKKLDGASHDEAAGEIAQGAEEMRDNWLGECEKTVGTPYRHENLTCAMKAKTMKEFDDCWYGRAP